LYKVVRCDGAVANEVIVSAAEHAVLGVLFRVEGVPPGDILKYSSRSSLRTSGTREAWGRGSRRGTSARLHVCGEDPGQVRHRLDELADAPLLCGFRLRDDSSRVSLVVGSTRVKDEQRSLVDIREPVAIVGKDVRLLNR
jgi:hypothetical protein